jgi:hypothetical protein
MVSKDFKPAIFISNFQTHKMFSNPSYVFHCRGYDTFNGGKKPHTTTKRIKKSLALVLLPEQGGSYLHSIRELRP